MNCFKARKHLQGKLLVCYNSNSEEVKYKK